VTVCRQVNYLGI